MAKEQRNFIGGAWKRNGNYGDWFVISLNKVKLMALQEDQYGNVKLTMNERKEPDERSKQTHSVCEYVEKPRI